MDMKSLEGLKAMLCDELEEIARKPEMSAGDLEAVHKLTDTIKNIQKINMLEEDGYSFAADEGRVYNRGNSYANRGKHYVRGHYSRDGGQTGRTGYSRNDGRDYMINQMERLMDETGNEKEREAIRRCIEKLENA